MSLPNQFYNNKKNSKKICFWCLTKNFDKLYVGGLATKVFLVCVQLQHVYNFHKTIFLPKSDKSGSCVGESVTKS